MIICFNLFQIGEDASLKTDSTDAAMPCEGWQMGPSSSCVNDIANDDFLQILHIDETSDVDDNIDDENRIERRPIIQINSNNLHVPQIRTSLSDTSICNLMDSANSGVINQARSNQNLSVPYGHRSNSLTVPGIRSAPSDVSISLFLDQHSNEPFDENTFADVNTNLLNPTRYRTTSATSNASNVSISHILDQA